MIALHTTPRRQLGNHHKLTTNSVGGGSPGWPLFPQSGVKASAGRAQRRKSTLLALPRPLQHFASPRVLKGKAAAPFVLRQQQAAPLLLRPSSICPRLSNVDSSRAVLCLMDIIVAQRGGQASGSSPPATGGRKRLATTAPLAADDGRRGVLAYC